ncbi:hypothetical protein RI129_003882, partial [Pyrocoelia pectoralis]
MNSIFLILLLISSRTSSETEENSSQLENASESEQTNSELEAISSRWTDWSEWSPCSRSCDGGVARQFRKCQALKCRGEYVRYKICNIQPCPVFRDFRDEQCAAFNNVLYQGSLFVWSAEYDERNPCSLTCRGKASSFSNDLEGNEPLVVVAQLNDKVEDGTRCRQGSLDMCIDGKCL